MSKRAKANFFIVGAPKCGTTAWFEYLRAHPQVFFAEVKEPTFFAPDLPGAQWAKTVDQFEKLYRRAGDARVLGDASATHLYSEVAASRIHDYNPDAKILICLRPQEEYLPSLHHHLLSRFEEQIEDFSEAWSLSGHRPPGTIPDTCTEPKFLDYKAMGRFHEQVARYVEQFPASQIKLLWLNEWKNDPRTAYIEMLDFLGLDDDGRTEFGAVNEAKSYPVKWVGKLITHPPAPVRAAVSVLRKLAGKDALGLGVFASKLVSSRGYKTQTPPHIRAMISDFYEAENKKLRRLLKRLATSSPN